MAAEGMCTMNYNVTLRGIAGVEFIGSSYKIRNKCERQSN